MADEVVIRGTKDTAKVRNPLGPLALTIVTVGFYFFFWWYFINREMNDLGEVYDDDYLKHSPGMAVLAMTLGAFVLVPPFVSAWRTFKRVERAQERVLGSNNFSPTLVFVLALIPIVSLITPVMVQSNLNQVWEKQ